MTARYVVVGLTGYAQAPSSHPPATSYSVLDSAYCWSEVFRAYASTRGRGGKQRLRLCQVECDRLNAMDAQQVAA